MSDSEHHHSSEYPKVVVVVVVCSKKSAKKRACRFITRDDDDDETVYRLFVTNERSLSKEDKKISLKRRERQHRTETLNISVVKN